MCSVSVRTPALLHSGIRAVYTTLKTHKAKLYCEEGVSEGQEGKGLEGHGQASRVQPVSPEVTPWTTARAVGVCQPTLPRWAQTQELRV